jgi:RNA polymerase sigma-70 factor (ECF subfamily)
VEEDELMPVLRRAAEGDQIALHDLMEKFRKPLARMIDRRLDRQLKTRVDASDVVQDSYLEAWKHLPEYVANPAVPFVVWLRQIVSQQAVAAYRTHVVAQMRSAHRETSLNHAPVTTDESQILADRLAGPIDSPSFAAMRDERRAILVETLETMEPDEREILTLRHFDGLNSVESAELLGITPAAASKRYIRAIKRLQGLLHERKVSGDLSLD